MTWTAVVPVKAWRSGKSRMAVDLRQEIARALTLDTLDVLTSHPEIARVVVVTNDAEVAQEAGARGAVVLAEGVGGLNGAVRQGCDWVAQHADDGPTVVVPADLAYLSADVLGTTLAALANLGMAHVADRAGSGTTLLSARSASRIDPHYGIGSSELHRKAGFVPLEDADERARTDIDQLDDLNSAWIMGPRLATVIGQRSA